LAEVETVETVEAVIAEEVIKAAPAETKPGAAVVEAKQDAQHKGREFEPEQFGKLMEVFGPQIEEYTGVTALKAQLARKDAITDYGLTAEEAAALPGKTADEIISAAKFTAGIIAKRVEAAKAAIVDAPPVERPFYLPSEIAPANNASTVEKALAEYRKSMA